MIVYCLCVCVCVCVCGFFALIVPVGMYNNLLLG